jgi:hypothetical protein
MVLSFFNDKIELCVVNMHKGKILQQINMTKVKRYLHHTEFPNYYKYPCRSLH